MGSGSFTTKAYASYSTSLGRSYCKDTGRVSGQTFESKRLDESLNPKKFTIRECANNEEHPNTIPVILALDVTGSLGEACSETAAALGVIITNLYKKFKDIEFCVMGIGDLAYDDAPIQMSQFESDVRIAEALDKIFMEHGGGGNAFESYTAAWYMGLHHTKLDCFDKQGRKGIIITMGDEPLNPYLPKYGLSDALGINVQGDIDTKELYDEASKKFDIFHIAVDSPRDCYRRYKGEIENSFGQVLGNRLRVATLNQLADVVEECITESVGSTPEVIVEEAPAANTVNENGEISW
jgi:hypothetical protein